MAEFQRRGNTLNVKRLKEEALAHRYGTYPIEPQLLLQLIERLEKAENGTDAASSDK